MQQRHAEWRYLFTPEPGLGNPLIVAASVRGNTLTLYTGPSNPDSFFNALSATPIISNGYPTGQIRIVHREDTDHGHFHSGHPNEIDQQHTHIMFAEAQNVTARQIRKLLLQAKASNPKFIHKDIISKCVDAFEKWREDPDAARSFALASNSPEYVIRIKSGQTLSISEHMSCLELSSGGCNLFNPRTPPSFLPPMVDTYPTSPALGPSVNLKQISAPFQAPMQASPDSLVTPILVLSVAAIAASAFALKKAGFFGDHRRETEDLKTGDKMTKAQSALPSLATGGETSAAPEHASKKKKKKRKSGSESAAASGENAPSENIASESTVSTGRYRGT